MVFVIHWHESAMDLHVFCILIPPPTSLSTPSLWVFPVHQAWALVSCTQPGLVICFTKDNKHVSMLFSWNIPPSPFPTDPMDYIVHGILQARILGWVVFPFSRGSSQPRDQTQVSCIAGGFFTSLTTNFPGKTLYILIFIPCACCTSLFSSSTYKWFRFF